MAFGFDKIKQSLRPKPTPGTSAPMGIRGMAPEQMEEDPVSLEQLPTDVDIQMGLQPAVSPYEERQSFDPNLRKRLNMPRGGGY